MYEQSSRRSYGGGLIGCMHVALRFSLVGVLVVNSSRESIFSQGMLFGALRTLYRCVWCISIFRDGLRSRDGGVERK